MIKINLLAKRFFLAVYIPYISCRIDLDSSRFQFGKVDLTSEGQLVIR